MAKKRTAKLKITNCLDCPHHKIFNTPSSEDSFDAIDIGAKCTKTARWISRYDRPWELRSNTDVPSWCPLLK